MTRISIADWLSLDDEVSYRDLATAMERAWNASGLPRGDRSADVVLHSTGALVVRYWLTTFYTPESNPIDHLLMLAPANYGSPLAHKGRAFYGRIIKGWRTGFQTGTKILRGLELGSEFTYELALADVLSRKYWYGKNRIKATVLVGNRGYGGVRAAANEDGSDGTVRISAANLDARLLEVNFSQGNETPSWNIVTPPSSYRTAFSILDGDNHGSVIMKEDNTPRNPLARELYLESVSVGADQWDVWCDRLNGIRRDIEQSYTWRHASESHTFQNTVTRVFDDIGNAVPDYFVEFYEHDSDQSALGRFFHRDVLTKVHRPDDRPNYRSMYIDTTLLHHRIDKPDVEHLEISVIAEPRFTENAKVGYPEEPHSVRLTPEEVQHLFRPNETLLVNIILKRKMRNVFDLRNFGDSLPN